MSVFRFCYLCTKQNCEAFRMNIDEKIINATSVLFKTVYFSDWFT